MNTEVDRKIAVILVADVVGYSKHMERDENATLKAYAECEKLLKACLKKYKGSIFNTAGDSALAEFPSAVNAVECGVAFQSDIKKRNESDKTEVKLAFRIGINMGDVVKKEGNLFGDGVNIAARLEALAQPSGISISKSVYDLVVPKTKMTFNDLGVQKVKQNEFHAFDILLDPSQKRTLKTKSSSMLPIIGAVAAVFAVMVGVFYFTFFQNEADGSKPIISADKPSILVMNFENLTKDEDNGFLGNGITTSIRSVLNSTDSVKIPPSSTTNFIAKNQYDNTQIHEKYGYDFILRGNVQGAGSKIRISVEMTDLTKESILFSNIYDFDDTKDVFDLQDEIALSILQATRIETKLARPEPISKDPETYKMHIKAQSLFTKMTPPSNNEAERLWKKALEKEPENYRFMVTLGWVNWQKIVLRMSENPDNSQAHLLYAISLYNEEQGAEYYEKRKDLLKSIRLANSLDPNNPMVYPIKAYFEYRFDEETELRSVLAFKGLDMEPENILSLLWTGHAFWMAGCCVSKFETELLFNSEYFEKVIELAPYGPPSTKLFLLAAYTEEKKLKDANFLVDGMLNSDDRNLNFWGSISNVFLLIEEGKKDEAEKFLNEFMEKNDLSAEDIFENLFKYPFYAIHGDFFGMRYSVAIQEALGLNTDSLDSYLWNRNK